MRNAIKFWFSLLYEEGRRGFFSPVNGEAASKNLSPQAQMCKHSTFYFKRRCVGRTQSDSRWIPFPEGLALPCGSSLEFLSEFQGQTSLCRSPLRCPLFWSLRSPLYLPLLILNCKSSSCLSANFWASLGYASNSLHSHALRLFPTQRGSIGCPFSGHTTQPLPCGFATTSPWLPLKVRAQAPTCPRSHKPG